MQEKAKIRGVLVFFLTLFLQTMLTSCSYNPFITNQHETGSPVATALGAGIGGGVIAALGGHRLAIGLGALTGGVVGYYVSTLRYDAGGILQGCGQVYAVGDMVGIYIPSDQLFEPNTDEFLPQSRDILDSTATVLARYPSNNILISGNTSGFYRSRWEQELSVRRAQKVAGYLWSAGINNFERPGNDLRKLAYVGYGDYFPISQTYTNNGIRTNSRIQITSYPSSRDLGLDARHIAVYNVAGLDGDTCYGSSCNTYS